MYDLRVPLKFIILYSARFLGIGTHFGGLWILVFVFIGKIRGLYTFMLSHYNNKPTNANRTMIIFKWIKTVNTGNVCLVKETQDKECRKHVFGGGGVREGSRELHLKCSGYTLPQGSINWAELNDTHQSLLCQQLPLLKRTLPMAFCLWYEDKQQNGPSISSPKLSKWWASKEGEKKNLVSRSPSGMRNEFMPMKWCHEIINILEDSVPWSKVLAESQIWKEKGGYGQCLWSLSFTAMLVTGKAEHNVSVKSMKPFDCRAKGWQQWLWENHNARRGGSGL